MSKQTDHIQRMGRIYRDAERKARRKAKACVVCGLCICPGARGKKCIARKGPRVHIDKFV